MHASMLTLVYRAVMSALQNDLFASCCGGKDSNFSKCWYVFFKCVGIWSSSGERRWVTNQASFSVGLLQHETIGRTLQLFMMSSVSIMVLASNLWVFSSMQSDGKWVL